MFETHRSRTYHAAFSRAHRERAAAFQALFSLFRFPRSR